MEPAGQRVPEKLVAEIANGNLEGIKKVYNSEDPSKKPDLLAGIVERAAAKEQVDIIDWTFSEGFQPESGVINNGLYHQACYARSLDVWKVLVKHGFNINQHSEFIGDVLSMEAYYGDIEIIRFLLENGLDPNEAWAYDEREPGVWALIGEKPSMEIIHLMLEYSWRPQESATHIAAAELGNMEALQLLVEYGADLELVQPWWPNPGKVEVHEWGTALYRAAYKGQAESVEYLLNAGAKSGFKDEKGRSILWAAKQGGNERVIRLLEAAGLKE